MPGIIAFGRRWSVGSDDFVVPAVFLFVLHFIWFIVAIGLFFGTVWDTGQPCAKLLWIYYIAFLAIMGACMLVELAICIAALRGGILNTEKRAAVPYLIYIRLVLMLVEVAWFVLAIKWLVEQYTVCPATGPKEGLLGMVICMCIIHVSAPASAWCVWDAAGRSWVKMKRYQQRSVSSRPGQQHRRRSGSRARNWRQRKVMRAYQDSWDQRCRFLFCCMRRSDRNKNSFADIARLLNDFFRDLDVVPSDVIAGLVLLRKFQKIERDAIVKGHKDDIHAFLSGVKVTSKTQFLALNNPPELEHFQNVIHYMHYALSAYGWPIYLITHSMGVCQLCPRLRCGCIPCVDYNDDAAIVDDNCCQCNYAALRQQLGDGEVEITYATFHVDIGQTPFFIAVDYGKKAVVISIRGTLSIQDILTDLNAEGETLPLSPPIDDWLGHKGMVEAAEYIRNKIKDEQLLEKAFRWNPARGSDDFKLVVVGHSLGGGTAAILAILLRPEYPTLECFSYSPPGGLLSMPAVQYSKAFTTSVVVGKDVVPRIGLHQMESLRADLINAIKRSIDPKWKTIACSAVCCGCAPLPRSATALSTGGDTKLTEYQQVTDENDGGYDNQLFYDPPAVVVHAPPPSISGALAKRSVDASNPTATALDASSNAFGNENTKDNSSGVILQNVLLGNIHNIVTPVLSTVSLDKSSNILANSNESKADAIEDTRTTSQNSCIEHSKKSTPNYFELSSDNTVFDNNDIVNAPTIVVNIVNETVHNMTQQNISNTVCKLGENGTTYDFNTHGVEGNTTDIEINPNVAKKDKQPILYGNEIEKDSDINNSREVARGSIMKTDSAITAQPIGTKASNSPVLASLDITVDKRMRNVVNVASYSGDESHARPCGDTVLGDNSSVSSERSAHSADVFLRSCRTKAKDSARVNAVHPSDSSIALTLHNPLYPPGRIIHVVRHHPSETEQVLPKREPVYQAVWAENVDFDEVLISPVMIQDHMPDKVLAALNKVLQMATCDTQSNES